MSMVMIMGMRSKTDLVLTKTVLLILSKFDAFKDNGKNNNAK